MRHKNNYGFNNFSFIKRKKISKYLIVICAILVTSLTIGFASFSSSLVMKSIAVIRVDKTVRLTGISVNSTSGNSISRNEEYSVSNIFGDVVLPSKDSYVKYEVDITNLGNVKMGALPPAIQTPICTPVTTATTGNVPSGNFNYGDEYTCQVGDNYSNTFFIIENNADTVSLIMKENFIDSYVPQIISWCTDGGDDTSTCKNISTTGSEAPSGKDYLSHIKSIFNKDGVEVSFPTKDQIYKAAGNKDSGLPIWLFDYMHNTTNPAIGIRGYWTITPVTDSSNLAWFVARTSNFSNGGVTDDDSTYGVRPVIKISKSAFGADTSLNYTIDGYSTGEAIPVCDGDNCTNGVTKKIYVTIKYKDGIDDSLVTSEPQSFNIGFNYKQIFKVTYSGVTCTNCDQEVLEGNTYTATIDSSTPSVIMGDMILTKDIDYTYDETTKLLTIPNVSGDITIREQPRIYSNGEAVYFNVDTGKICTDYTESQSETEVKSGCMKFYAFNDNGGDKVNLILDHNTTKFIEWNNSDDVTNGPTLLLDQLKTDTSSWKGTLTPTNSSHPNYTIDYTGYKARLITAEEVAKITGNTSFDITTDEERFFYFDTNTSEQSDTCRYDSETETDITSGCNYQWLSGTSDEGYWTSTQFVFDTSSILAYLIYEDSSMIATDIYNGSAGIRPVIEVPKSSLEYSSSDYICESTLESLAGNVSTGQFNEGDEYTCKVNDTTSYNFYVLNSDKYTVNLIMDRNICPNGKAATESDTCLFEWVNEDDYKADEIEESGYDVESKWQSSGSTDRGPLTALYFLDSATESWSNIANFSEKYIDEGNHYGSIMLTGKARLIKKSEIKNYSSSTKYLYNNLATSSAVTGTSNISGINGYWSLSTEQSDINYIAVSAYKDGYYMPYNVLATEGIRPIINVPKSRMKINKTICKAVTEATTGNVPSGSFAYGDEYTCKVGDSYSNTFFIIENNADTVSLIMKENYIDSSVPQDITWCTDGGSNNNTCKNIGLTGTSAVEGKDYLGHIRNVFNKDGVIVNLATHDQIYKAAGDKEEDLPVWLYDYLQGTTHSVSGVQGYWTSTPNANRYSYAWRVYYGRFVGSGVLTYSGISSSMSSGVRPVITISKDLIN